MPVRGASCDSATCTTKARQDASSATCVFTDGTKNLQSGTDTGKYTLFVEAYDKGPTPILTSAKRLYYIQGKTGLISPVFNTGNTMFKQNENTGGIVEGQALTSSTNADYSHWDIDTPSKLFVLCTDDNVYQRGTKVTPELAGDRDPACSTYTTEATCETLSSGCVFEGVDPTSPKTCVTRQQSLRYQVVPSSTFPELPESNVLKIDKFTAELSFNSDLLKTNYEELLIPDANVHCDLGPPVRSGDGDLSADPPNPFQWVGRYPNGVKGICRMFDNTQKKQ